MSRPSRSPYVFTLCQPGAEVALKREIATLRPGWRPSYARPGFVTFKADELVDAGVLLGSILARGYSTSLGKGPASEVSELIAIARRFKEEIGAHAVAVSARERVEHREPPMKPLELLADVTCALGGQECLNAFFGKLVLDVVLVESNEWWIGAHIQSDAHRPWPGGVYPKRLPLEAPSRAYLKLEEGLDWSRLPVRGGDRAIEVGAAPGGASYALLQRGLSVVGVDPAAMSQRVLEHPRFTHHRSQAGQLTASDAPGMQWLFSDINVEPEHVLRDVRKIVSFWQETLLGGLITVKLREWSSLDEIGAFIAELKSYGFAQARVAHLFNNRQEVCVALMTPLGLKRASSSGLAIKI